MSPLIAPTLEDLEAALAQAERAIVCADMIDNQERRRHEVERATRHRDALVAQIARMRESF